MNSKSKVGLGLLLGVAMGLPLGTVYTVVAEKPADVQPLPLEQLRTLSDVYDRIKNDYVEDVDDKVLFENAIKGMLSGLDPHSNYLNEEEFRDLQIGTSGEFGGLGIEVGMEDGFVKVISPIDDTPAAKAGIQSGDLIIRLDDTPVKGMSLNDAVNLMRGKVGSDITLTVIREGQDKPLKFTITRDTIQVQSVKSRMLDDGFGYIRITSFQAKTTQAMNEAAEKLMKESGGSLKGLVLDLRNNPGGVLTGAVGVSDAFLDKGLIVYTEGRVSDSKLRYDATAGDVINGAPLVVLVNGGSASASEIVSGALQDHKRAVIMGAKTFGKGSVQTILPLKDKDALKLTTARYFTPSGRSIQADGIEPDVSVSQLKVAKGDDSGFEPLKEANLSGHLTQGEKAEEKQPASATSTEENKDDLSLAEKDYELYEALNLLKGLVILSNR